MNILSAELLVVPPLYNPPANSIGATVLFKALAHENVEYIWGYPGGTVLYIYDELYKQNQIQHILVRPDQGAVHAADGYARSTGKVGFV